MVGFDRVAALARDAGVKNARGTPSMAIGSYDATPLDMAGAYTVFANDGVHLDPWMLASVRTPTGDVITDYTPDVQAGARSARGLSDHQHDGERAATARATRRAGVRNMGFVVSGRGQDRHQPRRVVRRLHQQPALHRVGGQRRLHRYRSLKARMPPRPSGRSS